MELITNGRPTCDCYAKLGQLEANLNAEGTFLHLGAVVRCDCGEQYRLHDTQFSGRLWSKVGPAPASR